MADHGSADEGPVLARARFSDRLLAFSIDLGLLIAGYIAFLVAAARVAPAFVSESPLLLLAFWGGVFVAYHGLLNADGRTTLGKRVAGVAVYTADGYPPSLGRSFARSCAYLLSNVLFGLGYLWALTNKKRLTWHDLLAGTMVLETRPKSVWGRRAATVSAWSLACVYAVMAVWTVAAPHYYNMRLIANARNAVGALALLQEKHHATKGRYTSDVTALASIFGDTDEFYRLLADTMDLSQLKMEAGRDRYVIRAQALDDEGTLLELVGPPKGG